MPDWGITRRLPQPEQPVAHALLDEGKLDMESLLQLIDEQEALIEQRSRDLAVAHRSLERARTQWLVLQRYNAAATLQEREEAAQHLEGIAAYVQQLEDSIESSRDLIRAYKRARFDNLPWIRAFRFVQRRLTGELRAPQQPAFDSHATPPALEASRDHQELDS
ncbi:MAG: hypothetical protein M1396_03745 [Chloroflexi bacterium]|nr:hypothetical protein [Chloroflexota bacterium]